MSHLSQKCRCETGGRWHSLSFPERKKKTEIMDPEEVTNLTGWVRLRLRLDALSSSGWQSSAYSRPWVAAEMRERQPHP